MTTFQSIKLALVEATGLSKDMLHVYVGLALFLGFALVTRTSLRSPRPWLVVAAAALLGELWDLVDDMRSTGVWRWWNAWRDALNTLFWPTVLLLLARTTKVLRR